MWDLQTAFNKIGVIIPGDTVLLHDGIYTHLPQNSIPGSQEGYIFQVTVSGNSSAQITFKSAPGEWARIDGGAYGGALYGFHACARPTITVGNSGNPNIGNYITFQDIEFYSSSTEGRLSGDDSSFPTSITRSDGPNDFGTGVRFINCIIHDCSNGVSAWRQSQLNEFYGNVIYNNGWQGTPNKHGHNFYTQHSVAASGLATIKRNISMGPYDWGIQAYGSSATEISHYRISENVFIGNQIAHGGILVGTRSGGLADRLIDNQVLGNYGYGADLAFYYAQNNDSYRDLLGANNYFYKCFWELSSWKSGIFTNNWIISPALNKIVDIYPNTPVPTIVPWNMNRNIYVVQGLGIQVFGVETEAPRTFAQWQTRTGYDANSIASSALPAGTNYAIIQSNIYDTNRAQAAFYNWTLSNFIALDVSSFSWGIGSTVLVRNAQNYFVDVVATPITATNTLIIDMRAAAHSVAIPYGDTVPTAPLTFPDFGAFVLQKISTATNIPPPIITRTTAISSINPASAVAIAVTPADFNGASNGSTPFSRTNVDGVISSLVAPATASGNTFVQWTRNGVLYVSGLAMSYTNTADVSFVAVYATPIPPSTNYTVTVSTVNPSSGITITSTPNDNGGLGSGTAAFLRTNIQNRVTTLTAPATAAGNNFDHWERNGVTYSTSAGITFTNVSNVSFTAFYLTPPPPPPTTVILTVNSSNPSTGLFIQMAPADKNGASNGSTPFARQVLTNTVTMLTAPLRSGPGTTFQKWQRNGVDFENNLAVTFTNNAATIMTAIYLSLGPTPSATMPAISYRRGARQ